MKFEFTRALVRARKEWDKRDRSGNYLTVALSVHNYANGDGTSSYASAARISTDTGIPTRTVERALKFLRDEGLIHLDRSGGRSGDGSTWASEYSLRIPGKWSDVAESKRKALESQPAMSAYRPATTEPQLVTGACQPAASVADHQILNTTSDSSNPNTTDTAPDPSEQPYWAPTGPMTHTKSGLRAKHLRTDSLEPDWGAMEAAMAIPPNVPF